MGSPPESMQRMGREYGGVMRERVRQVLGSWEGEGHARNGEKVWRCNGKGGEAKEVGVEEGKCLIRGIRTAEGKGNSESIVDGLPATDI